MRDAHRMKEKFDVSLDNRQIVSLLIAGIIVMGAVFVLGVVVGKNLAGNAQTAGAPDLLSALDANAQALQEVQKEPPLTFQDELTRKAAEPVAPPPVPKPAPKPAPAKPVAVAPTPAPAEQPAPAAETGEEVAANAADDELAALAAKPSPAAPAAPVAKAPAPAPVPAGKVEQEPTPTRTATPPVGSLKEAIARATQPPAEAVKGGAFTLQISAFQSREDADRFAARLRDRGYAPYILAAEVPNKGTWYRVRMGSFPSKEAASRYLADFKRETQLNAFVAGTN
ncbi:Cell division protein DedD (protein involved in septation) [Stigmatella aurantiaca]|uniref:Cell division protein DedD (Protein involved in septation) n=1 Tax=Stigmatella aurantiaca TaxID=41 RepID=A0A1H8DE96_STIAU|nr:SPOR domain-containing protein [Stigmatella aurantiaca]SEN04817.1 Cell division protein DedD (protein involved in septation) [Stigmatella aurantiaca]